MCIRDSCKTNIPNFYVIFSGPVPPNPSELLGNDAFRILLEYLRKEYDYVIVDTPVSYTHLDVYKRQPYSCLPWRAR